jgi:hypothetical protein
MGKWLDEKGSLYNNKHDNKGRPLSIRELIFTQFAIPHRVYGKQYNDIETICKLRNLDRTSGEYKKDKDALKDTLQGFTPAALLGSREKDNIIEVSRTGLAQLDFDGKDNIGWNMAMLKEEIFRLPFICFCGLSCSGEGIYALAAIAEPLKLREYVEQMFWVFSNHGINVDRSKGRNVQDLRYLSYDANMLVREDPEPLKINNYFKDEAGSRKDAFIDDVKLKSPERILHYWIKELRAALNGNRWKTICRVAVCLGSKRNESFLEPMLDEINTNELFRDGRNDFLKIAKDQFNWGWQNPLQKDI